MLLWARGPVDSIAGTFNLAPSLGLRSTRLYFLGTCYRGYRWRIEFSVPLLSLSQLQSYLVPCISTRIFIIPKLPNIRCKQFLSELFSLCIEHLPDCYSARPNIFSSQIVRPDWCFREHLSHALPTEMIFDLLRSIPSERLTVNLSYPILICDYSEELMADILEIIIKWLQVSC